MTFFAQSCVVLLAARCIVTSAMMIEGESMSIDAAIIKAGSNNSKMFELMQNDDTVMVELDMLYKMETYRTMREEMEEMEREDAQEGSRRKRKAISGDYYRWPNARVPYDINTNTMTASHISLIRAAIRDYEEYTCLRFPEATSRDSDRIRFQNGGGCSSYVGRIGGIQGISLAGGCRYKGIIIHEIGHAIGFNHEQTRPDRDSYVTIHTQNIQRGLEYNFYKHAVSQQNSFGVPYDYTSVMHYSQDAFTSNGRITIQARQSQYQNSMGNREGLSFNDIKLANAMYNCNGRCANVRCPAGAFQGQDCRCYCASNVRSSPIKVCGTVGPTVTTETPTTAAPVVCEDKQSSCDWWQSQGYCRSSSYTAYMRENCPVACRYCTEMTTTPRPRPTTAAPGSCVDDHDTGSCAGWARTGYCATNTFVMNNCKKSCNLCSKEVCMETNQHCKAWADYGACTMDTYKEFMRTNCPISCGICTSYDESTATAAPPARDCVNKRSDAYCLRKQKAGKCGWSQNVMQGCRKTCELCSKSAS